MVKRAQRVGEPVILKGNAHPISRAPEAPLFGNYALTYGIDADFMTEWMKQNASHPAVRENLIFIHEKPSMVEGKAKEHAATRSGLEPIDPNNLPKDLKRIQKEGTAIT